MRKCRCGPRRVEGPSPATALRQSRSTRSAGLWSCRALVMAAALILQSIPNGAGGNLPRAEHGRLDVLAARGRRCGTVRAWLAAAADDVDVDGKGGGGGGGGGETRCVGRGIGCGEGDRRTRGRRTGEIRPLLRCRGGADEAGEQMSQQDQLDALEKLLREASRQMDEVPPDDREGIAALSGKDGPLTNMDAAMDEESAAEEAAEWEAEARAGGEAPPKEGVWIRRATVMDVADIQRINLVCLPENYQARYFWYHMMRWPELALVAEENAPAVEGQKAPGRTRVVGYVIGKMDDDEVELGGEAPVPGEPKGHVTSLAVLRSHRRRGLAMRLMVCVMRRMVSRRGAKRCSLHVRSHNGPAMKLYVSLLRFKVEKVERDYYADREDALSMVREISKESMGPLWYQAYVGFKRSTVEDEPVGCIGGL